MRIFRNALIVSVVVVVGFAVCGPLFTCATRTRGAAVPQLMRGVGSSLRTVAKLPVHLANESWRLGKAGWGAIARIPDMHVTFWALARGKPLPFYRIVSQHLEDNIPNSKKRDSLQNDFEELAYILDHYKNPETQGYSLSDYQRDSFLTTMAATLILRRRDTIKDSRYKELPKKAKRFVESTWTVFRDRYSTMIGKASRDNQEWREAGPEETVDATVRLLSALTPHGLPKNWKKSPRTPHDETTALEVYPWNYYIATDGEIAKGFVAKLNEVAESLYLVPNAGVKTPVQASTASARASDAFSDAITKIFVESPWKMSPEMPGWFNYAIMRFVLKRVVSRPQKTTPGKDKGLLFVITVLTWWWLAAEATKTEGQVASSAWISSFRSKLAVCLKHFAGSEPWKDFDEYHAQLKTFTSQINDTFELLQKPFPIKSSGPLLFFTLEKDPRFDTYKNQCDSAEILEKLRR